MIDIHYIEKNLSRLPIQFFVNKYQCTVAEITGQLRKRRLLSEVEACEINYIIEASKHKPLKEIQKELYLTDTQFSQIISRQGIGKKLKSIDDYTEEEIINQTRNFLENVKQYDIDDTLPKVLRVTDFSNTEYSHLPEYAKKHLKKDPYYKYFSASAYLCELAYPGQFKPYQFPSTAETKKYFTRNKYLSELIYIMENKLYYNLDNIENLVRTNGFLKKSELDLYGLGYHTYKGIFTSKKEIFEELQQTLLLKKEGSRYDATELLRTKLREEGINPERCFVEGCENTSIEIHHMVAKRYEHSKPSGLKNIDDVEKLIPLCACHHDSVYDMPLSDLSKEKSRWREDILAYIAD